MNNNQWWKQSTVYQIYVRSFQDSNNDGIGDLNGITARLDTLQELGVEILWLTPICESPNDDNGYDISDYTKIAPEYGTLADFDRLLTKAHQRGLKIMLDLVFNHTSDEHFWFKESRKSKDNPYRDYYIWKDPKDDDEPNNWTSCFQGPAWEYDAATEQYYLHLFSKKQPDLNWQNPAVRQACYDIMNYWVDRGVDGFRLDVINLLSKESFADSPIKGHQVAANGPKIHQYLQELNQHVLQRKPLVTVGETPAVTVADAIQYATLDNTELSMVFQFEMMNVDGAEENKWTDRRYNLHDLKEIMTRWQVGVHQKAWNSLFWNNHDQPRVVSRFGDSSTPLYHEKSAKMLAIFLHMMQGTPYVYQGEEIGMTNVPFTSLADYRDIDSLNSYRQLVEIDKTTTPEAMLRYLRKSSRDNARTPMQWDTGLNAGFSEQKPWIMVNPNYSEINVKKAPADTNSIFYTYQHLIRLRKELPIITEGDYTLLLQNDPNIYAYKRSYASEHLIVLCNFSNKTVTYEIPELAANPTIVISNYPDAAVGSMRPYEAVVYNVKY